MPQPVTPQALATDALRVRDLLTSADKALGGGEQQVALALLTHARAVEASPEDRYAVGEALLRASNARHGWDLYDLHPSRPADRLPRVRRWNGEHCPLLILVAEQGFGDAIQFLRFVPQVIDRAEKVVLAVHDELLDVVATSPLLDRCATVNKSTARRTVWPADARWERLMSLPSRMPEPDVGPAAPYLRIESVGTSPISPAAAGCLTVGVAWRSTPRRGFPNRSFPAGLTRQLVVPDRCRVFPLHRNEDVRFVPEELGTARISNFVETARAIMRCDYVVTSDTVTAHLAPALGVPTLICLRHRPDWRWGTPHHPTRWYARAELLFQPEDQTWAPVLAAAGRRILSGDLDTARTATIGATA